MISSSVADPGFSPGGAPTPKIAIIFQIFAKNCMKMKEFGPPGGARVPGAPLRSANGHAAIFCTIICAIDRDSSWKCYKLCSKANISNGWVCQKNLASHHFKSPGCSINPKRRPRIKTLTNIPKNAFAPIF